MKLFSITKNGFSIEYYILGIKIKFTNHKKKLNQIENNVHSLLYGGRYVYNNRFSLSINEMKKKCESQFFELLGYFPNLNNPRTLNEKLNWLKYNYFNPNENYCYDKATVKKYVASKIGEEYIIPTYGIYNTADEIDFTSLPEQVVLKNTVGGGSRGVIIIKELSKENLDTLKYRLNNLTFEWQITSFCLGLVPHRILLKERIIAEAYIENPDGKLLDYKFYCFNGNPKFVQLISERTEHHKYMNYYDLNWNKFSMKRKNNVESIINFKKPENFDVMIEISKKLSKDFPFVRVDLYNINGKIYFGELTFYPCGGFIDFCDKSADEEFGDMLDLSKIDKKLLISDQAKTLVVVERVISLLAYRTYSLRKAA